MDARNKTEDAKLEATKHVEAEKPKVRASKLDYTVTVLDAFSFKPLKDEAEPSDEGCRDLIAEVLLLKKPRVLLCCWSGTYTGHWV